jgi:hypothetical protein
LERSLFSEAYILIQVSSIVMRQFQNPMACWNQSRMVCQAVTQSHFWPALIR